MRACGKRWTHDRRAFPDQQKIDPVVGMLFVAVLLLNKACDNGGGDVRFRLAYAVNVDGAVKNGLQHHQCPFLRRRWNRQGQLETDGSGR
jgi:hypothetical protein